MAKTTKTVIHADLTGQEVDDSEAMEIVVLEHPEIRRPVRLDASASEISGLQDLTNPLVRLRVDGQEITVEAAKFAKLFKGQEMVKTLSNAERATGPSDGGVSASGLRTALKSFLRSRRGPGRTAPR